MRFFLKGSLSGVYGVAPKNARRAFIVGNGLDLERMQLAEIGDLIERQRRVLDQPYGGPFRHKGLGRHDKFSLRSARPGGEA